MATSGPQRDAMWTGPAGIVADAESGSSTGADLCSRHRSHGLALSGGGRVRNATVTTQHGWRKHKGTGLAMEIREGLELTADESSPSPTPTGGAGKDHTRNHRAQADARKQETRKRTGYFYPQRRTRKLTTR